MSYRRSDIVLFCKEKKKNEKRFHQERIANSLSLSLSLSAVDGV